MTLLDSGNVPMQCTNIYDELEAGDRILFAKAVFTEGPVRGAIFISHVAYADGTNGETTLYSRGLTNYETYHATQVSVSFFVQSSVNTTVFFAELYANKVIRVQTIQKA